MQQNCREAETPLKRSQRCKISSPNIVVYKRCSAPPNGPFHDHSDLPNKASKHRDRKIMDVAASVTALITIAAQVGRLLSTYISEVKDAPEVLRNILSEISSLMEVLDNLKVLTNSVLFKDKFGLCTGNKGEHWKCLKSEIEDCLKTVGSLNDELDPLSEPHRKRPRLRQMPITHFRLRAKESKIHSYRLKILTSKDAIKISLLALNVTLQLEVQDSVGNLIPRLDETSGKIKDVLKALRERFQNIHLDDNDRESLGIARRVMETASDIVSTAASSIGTIVTDRTETQSVISIDPSRLDSVASWAGDLEPSASLAPMNLDLSILGCEALLERGRTALDIKEYRQAESLLEHYLAIVQSEELQVPKEEIIRTRLMLCQACLEQGNTSKSKRILEETSSIAIVPVQKAEVRMFYVHYHTHESTIDISAAESAWKEAANYLICAFGSLSAAPTSHFEHLKLAKLGILSRKNDSVELEFWSTALDAVDKTTKPRPNAIKKTAPKPRTRKPTTTENSEIGFAIKHGNLLHIQKLIAEGVNVFLFEDRTRYSSKYKCLHFAINHGQEELVEFFLQNMADPNQFSGVNLEIPLAVAAGISDKQLALKIFQLLLRYGAVVQTRQQFVLHMAIKRENIELVRIVLEKDPEIAAIINETSLDSSRRYYKPIVEATTLRDSNFQLEIVKLLVKAGANINEIYYAVPMFWHFNQLTPSFRYLIENGADVQLLGPEYSPESLLHYRYDPFHIRFNTRRDKLNNSPIPDLIPLFISKGADINRINGKGETPLISALKHGTYETALKLIELGCDVNAAGPTEDSALSYALKDAYYPSAHAFPGIACLLIEKGAKITPTEMTLHGAIGGRDEQLVKKLIEVGVDLNKCDLDGVSPLAKARALHPTHENILNLLVEMGAVLGTDQ